MVVQHNLIAMNASRMLGLTEKTVAGNTEKLSSGYQINRAADNAAGLAISEKMRKQMRGLTQAAVNAEDGISSVQTAEGALSEVQDMLQRMNELCVQAANGTNSSTDRQYIQDEIDQLCTEIDRVAETTKFNDTYLLKGDSMAATERSYIINYSVTYTRNEVSNADDNAHAMKYKVNYTGVNNVFMISPDILTANHSNAISADVVSTGMDLTPYMVQSAASTSTGKYHYSYVNEPIYEINAISVQRLKYYAFDMTTSATIQVTSNWDEYITYDGSAFALKNANVLSTTVAINDYKYVSDGDLNGTGAYNSTNNPDFEATLQGGLYSESNTLLTADNLADYFDEEGNYLGGIYTDALGATSIPAGDQSIFTYISKTDNVNSSSLNKAGAILNTDKYVAFVAVELNSNVAIGSDGNVNGDTTYDLSTDGITDTVRANRDLYVYTRKTGTITHLSPGDEMTKYLTTDTRMDDDYVLLDVLDGKNGVSTKVNKQMLGGTATNFLWDNSYVEMATSLQKLYDRNGEEVSGIRLNQFFDENGNYKGGLYTSAQARVIDQVFATGATMSNAYLNVSKALGEGKKAAIIDDYITTSSKSIAGDLDFSLHVGADSDKENKIIVTIAALTAAGLGVDKLTSDNIGIVDGSGQLATDAIDVIANAINAISRQRASLGAIQNRLEHTTNNLDNVVENTTAAESQIRDTDMAKEMVAYSNANILQQAGQAMLAQANQSNQGVMSLLQ